MAKCDPDRVNRKMIHVNEHPQVCCCGVQTWETMLGEEPAVKVALLGGLRGFMAHVRFHVDSSPVLDWTGLLARAAITGTQGHVSWGMPVQNQRSYRR